MNVSELERMAINLNSEFDRDRVEAWEYFCDIAPTLARKVIAAEKLVEKLREVIATGHGSPARSIGGIRGQTIEAGLRATMHDVSAYDLDVLAELVCAWEQVQ